MIGTIFVVTLVIGDFITVRFTSGSQSVNVRRLISNDIGLLQLPSGSATAVVLLCTVLITIGILLRFVDIRKEFDHVPFNGMCCRHIRILRKKRHGLNGTQTPSFLYSVGVLCAVAGVSVRPDDHHRDPVISGAAGRIDKSCEEAAHDQGAANWQTIRHAVLPIIAPSLIGVALFGVALIGVALIGVALSCGEFVRTLLTAASYNTLPLEIYGMTTNATTPVIFVPGTMATVNFFVVIGVFPGSVWVLNRRQARRVRRGQRQGHGHRHRSGGLSHGGAGGRFCVVTTLTVSIPILQGNILAYGLGPASARMRASGVPVLAINGDADAAANPDHRRTGVGASQG